MFIEFLFVAVLDMSLPEFQPQEDLSGNYIVMEYDSINDEIVVDEIPVEAIDGLSVEPQTENIKFGSVLRSGNVITIESSVLSNMRIRDGALQSHSGDNLNYIFLTAGVEYTLYNLSSIQTSLSLSRGATVTQIDLTTTFTPSEDCYILRNNNSFYVTYNSGDDVSGGESGGDISGGDISGGDVSGGDSGGNIIADLSNVESKLDRVIDLLRSILLVLLISFLYPLIMNCLKLMKGGRYV